jgi:putative redox protein
MARGGPSHEVVARWEGGLKVTVSVGDFSFVVDEPVAAGGGGEGPMPTDYFLGSLASCYALAIAWEAGKACIVVPPDLEVTAQGVYDGPSFRELTLRVTSSLSDEVLQPLLERASRVCYVSRTLANSPPIDVRRG